MLALTATVFLPSLRNGFVNWDDPELVTANPYVRSLSPANLAVLLAKPLTNIYHPLTFLSYAAEYRLWGTAPFGYHLTNLLLHLATAALVFRWITVLGGSAAAAAAGALFFALHPMRAEPVAWISGRKDLLAGFFFMASLLAFEAWTAAARWRWYAASLGLFLLAALSKATAVTLPAVLVLGDWLHRRALSRRAVLEKLPFFAAAAVLGAVAVVSRKRFESLVDLATDSPWERIHILGHRLVFYYLQRTAAPAGGFDNLYPDLGPGTLARGLLSWGAVLCLLLAAVAVSSRFTRKGVYGAGFFLLTLLPALTTVTYGYTADRFGYVPSIGLSLLAGTAVAAALRAASPRRPLGAGLLAACLATVVAMGVTTGKRIAVWKDSVSLWDDAVRQYRHLPSSVNLGLALENRGRSRLERGDYPQAVADLTEALRTVPEPYYTLLFRARAHAALGERAAAEADLREALRIEPDFQEAAVFLRQLSAPGP